MYILPGSEKEEAKRAEGGQGEGRREDLIIHVSYLLVIHLRGAFLTWHGNSPLHLHRIPTSVSFIQPLLRAQIDYEAVPPPFSKLIPLFRLTSRGPDPEKSNPMPRHLHFQGPLGLNGCDLRPQQRRMIRRQAVRVA